MFHSLAQSIIEYIQMIVTFIFSDQLLSYVFFMSILFMILGVIRFIIQKYDVDLGGRR